MCGIWGALTKNRTLTVTEVDKILPQLMIAGNLRGLDGAGLFSIHQDLSTKISKKAQNSFHLYYSKEFEEHRKEIWKTGIGYFGHNRAATKGSSSDKNTHPFETKNIVLLHNGTVTSGLIEHQKNHEVDSAALAHAIEEEGMEEVSKKVHMAYALIWYDKRDKSLHFCRNHERPLHILETASTYFFVSEPLMMQWILERNNEKINRIVTVDTLKEYIINLQTDEMKTNKLNTPTYSYSYNNYTPTKPWSEPEHKIEDQLNKSNLFTITRTTKVEQKKRNPIYIHYGKSTKGFLIKFSSTTEYKPKSTTELYEGLGQSLEKLGNNQYLIIKSKTVKSWLDPKPQPNNDDDTEILDLGDGNVIMKADFNDIHRWGCGCCRTKLYLNEVYRYALTPDGKELLCEKCTLEMFNDPKAFKEKLLYKRHVAN